MTYLKVPNQHRRARIYGVENVIFDETMCETMSQEQFFSNAMQTSDFLYLFYGKNLKIKILL